MLDVPIEQIDDSILFPGSDVSWSSVAHTLDPQDKFLAPRPAPLLPMRRPSTVTNEAPEQLKSPIPPLTGSSADPTVLHDCGERFGYESQNQCTAYERDDMRAKSATETKFSPTETPMEAHSFAMAKSRSCPETLLCTQDAIIDLQNEISEIPITEDCRPTTSYGESREVYLGMSSLQPHSGTSSSDDVCYRSFPPQVDYSLCESKIQRPMTNPDQFLYEADQSISRFSLWPGNGQDARLSDISPLTTSRSHVDEDFDFAVIMVEDDNSPSPYDMQQDEPDIVESAHSVRVYCHEPSTDLPSPCFSTATVQPPSRAKAQFLQLERPGLLRSKFSEWSVTSVDAPQSESSPTPEVEDMQSPTLSAVSYSSDGIITPRKQSEHDAGYIEQMMTSEGFESDEYHWAKEGFKTERSSEIEYGLADVVTGLRLADEIYQLQYDAWHTANADEASADAGAEISHKDNFPGDYNGIGDHRNGHEKQTNM